MTTRALSTDTALKTELEDCENKIKSAFRRGLLATCEIAKELHKIYSEELYKVKTQDFTEYVTISLNINIVTYRRIIAVSQTVAQLRDAGLELPANESQVAELARLDAPMRAKVWNDLVIRAEKLEKALTLEDIKHAVELAESQTPKREVEVEMEDKDNGSEPPTKKKSPIQEGVLVLTEKGEAALNRIRKICGTEIAQAIQMGIKAMTEREIKNWAEYDDEMMRQLVYYIIDQNWPLTKAVGFINKEVDDSTDVHDLILIASSRGGSARIKYDRANITIELTQQ
jgi:hypothetical protein